MIQRLDQSGYTRRTPEWPDPSDDPSDGYLFSARKPFRRLVVMIDADLLVDEPGKQRDADGQPVVDARGLLSAILQEHSLVQLLRFADDGPPPDVQPVPRGQFAEVFEGWAVLKDREPRDGVWSVVYPTPSGYSLSGVIGNAVDIAADDTQDATYADLSPPDARERRYADVLALQIAEQALMADLHVTERPYLFTARWLNRPGITVCRPDEALAIVSLYLRAQGEFVVAPRYHFNRGLFYWVGTRELLPSAWRWFAACVQHSTGSNDDALMLLGGSLLQRVDRALEARDAIHLALNRLQNNDTRDDALASLDVVLSLLMGAVDVTARVAHRVLGLKPSDEHRAAWQNNRKNGWRSQVATIAPTLAAIMDPGTVHEATLTILRLLRNSVHGAALSGIAFQQGVAPVESLVDLPVRDQAEIIAAMNKLGGEEAWGVRTLLPGRSHLDPGVFVDRLFPAVTELLNALMDKTPVEQLPHVNLSAADTRPPASPPSGSDPFAPWIRQSIRLQLGL